MSRECFFFNYAVLTVFIIFVIFYRTPTCDYSRARLQAFPFPPEEPGLSSPYLLHPGSDQLLCATFFFSLLAAARLGCCVQLLQRPKRDCHLLKASNFYITASFGGSLVWDLPCSRALAVFGTTGFVDLPHRLAAKGGF